jgi:hypothetical protein
VCLQHLLLRSLETFGNGSGPTDDHAAEIKNCPPPHEIKQLQCFLGMVNFYCRFLPKCAQILKPYTDLLKGGAKTLEWTVSAQEAFQNAKCLLAAAVPLQHSAPNAELSLATDASDSHIGGVMQQKSGNHWRPLGFFSCKLTDTESHYSTFDRELLAAHAATNISAIFAKVKHFNFGHLSLPFLVFQPPFHPDNSAIWHTFQNLMCKCCICPV